MDFAREIKEKGASAQLFDYLERNYEKLTCTVNPHVLFEAKKPVAPIANEDNILITSALPYVNNVPHLGNIIGCVLSADCFARFTRLMGKNVLYVCGTDEYGTATETKALEEKMDCQSLCNKYHAIHRQCYEWFDIEFDHFGRTTTPKQTLIAQDIFLKAEKNDFLLEQVMTQYYCPEHQSFLADRFVIGTCPHCKFDDARGDQCDGCQKLLNPTDLIKPKCKLDGATPILRDSTHLFLQLDKLEKQCNDWFLKESDNGKWSSNAVQITANWFKEGLKPRCITRDLKWGTPVPRKGYEEKVFYVWFDAPIGYLSITANYTDQWESWWKNENVKLYQFMGKDNVPFHTVIFPCALFATKEPWTLVHHISTTEYLQYEGTKFSKSRGIGVFGTNVMDSGIDVEVWRYYLFSVRPESSDSQFTWNGLLAANNNELLANLGNLVNRVMKFVEAKYNSKVPAYEYDQADKAVIADIQSLLDEYRKTFTAVKIRQALKLSMDMSARMNVYLQSNKLDTNLFLNNPKKCGSILALCLNAFYLFSSVFEPFMPSTGEKIRKMLQVGKRRLDVDFDGSDIKAGHALCKPIYLFKKLEEDYINGLRAKYGGASATPAPENGKEKKESGKKKGKKEEPAASAIPEHIRENPQVKELEDQIKAVGDTVRLLKTEKAPVDEIKKKVADLLGLKEKMKLLVESLC